MEQIKGQSPELFELLTSNPEYLEQVVEGLLAGSIADGELDDDIDFLTEQQLNSLPPECNLSVISVRTLLEQAGARFEPENPEQNGEPGQAAAAGQTEALTEEDNKNIDYVTHSLLS